MTGLINKIFRKMGYQVVKVGDNKKSDKVSKKTNRLTYYETTTGNFYLPTDAPNDYVANAIRNNQIFEEEVVDLAKKYIKAGTAVLDVGSNFGQMSILFSNMVGEKGKVYAFDADDFVFEILKKNIDANKKTNIIVPTFGAVHNVLDEILFFPEQDFKDFESYGSYGIDYNTRSGRSVKSVTIDSLNIQEPISFMKVDIQGGDLQALQGAVQTIQKNKMPILFEYEYHFEEKFNMKFQDYVDFVKSINYKFDRVISGHNFLIIPN